MQYVSVLDEILYRLRLYRDPQRIRNEVIDLIRQYPSLYPVQGSLQPSGPPLLHLVGTIPIIYGGVQYNIPIKLWIVDQYPYAPPTVFVSPTPEMIITPRHKHVDAAGMVYLPYLSTWSPLTCSLPGLAAVLSKVFSEDPPVRSQPAKPLPAQTGTIRGPATPPPQPPPQQQQPMGYPSQTPPYQQQSMTIRPSQQPPPYPYSTDYGQPQQPPPPPPIVEDPTVVLRRNVIKAATETLQKMLKEFYESTTKEIDSLMLASSEHNARNATFNQERDNLIRAIEQSELEIGTTESLLHDTEQWLAVHGDPSLAPNLDQLTDPQDPLSKQLLTLVADDATIEDVIYHLDKGLNNSHIDAEEYLKNVRKLSRDQFMIRATIKKVHEAQRAR
eukprot:TRINITY_DN2903_c0_g1_i1.p1 TRINITY_DN2903_c0_g1~~TRINITY_DN2903_c0_g1_i1.p1  ORF type:complete len:387 (+),score=78.78 TRINITY_DN2903_c0_g1_i1:171-1331(+)